MNMIYINENDISKLKIDINECFDWTLDMLKNKSNAFLPPKISIKPDDGYFYNVMPSVIPKYNIAGVKLVNRYPDRIPSLNSKIMLYDFESGNMKALLDGDFITSMRTACVAAHSIDLFAIKNFETVGFIGLGVVGRYVMKAIYNQLNGRKITVKLFNRKNQAEKFIEDNKFMKNIKFEICDTYEEIIKDSDVIISAVTYIEGLFCDKNELFKEGCLVVPVHTRGFQNCDVFFDKVYCDDIGHVSGFKDYDVFKNKLCEVSDVVNGLKKGRENDKERILVYNIGISIYDIYFSEKIYQLFTNK